MKLYENLLGFEKLTSNNVMAPFFLHHRVEAENLRSKLSTINIQLNIPNEFNISLNLT